MTSRFRLVVVGASWGGMEALCEVLQALPEGFPVPVAIAQHRSAQSRSTALVGVLDDCTPLRVVEADDKQTIEAGHVYLAPPDYHLLIGEDLLELSTDELVRYSRPSIDVLFESAADAYGSGVIGVILTGANDDGTAGLLRIRRRGGVGIVQDPDTAERREMPEAAIRAGAADSVLPLGEIARAVVELCADAPSPVQRKRT